MAEGILLSGATGFLGTNVLEQLIHHTDSEIYVLTDKLPIIPIDGLVSMMIKLKDEEKGSVHKKRIDKSMSEVDWENMKRGIEQCHVILEKLGIPREKHFLGTLNAGHPGGMLPLDASQKDTLHHPSLPDNLYVADATILPEAMGNPPILTIMALAKKIASILKRY